MYLIAYGKSMTTSSQRKDAGTQSATTIIAQMLNLWHVDVNDGTVVWTYRKSSQWGRGKIDQPRSRASSCGSAAAEKQLKLNIGIFRSDAEVHVYFVANNMCITWLCLQ